MPPFPASSRAVDDGPITPLILLRVSQVAAIASQPMPVGGGDPGLVLARVLLVLRVYDICHDGDWLQLNRTQLPALG
ncbi:hypothetical protein CDEST_06476 [Colletotrichum destructivum]|uniref:Uncharacterized protein n=1 Tax=Colletotrichum destructivum TaxID=34406 RepID=A0AAX4IDM6_9PEZI|nr:hypothetical protein CDEST_06476 [Colletotrichum destructivum]